MPFRLLEDIAVNYGSGLEIIPAGTIINEENDLEKMIADIEDEDDVFSDIPPFLDFENAEMEENYDAGYAGSPASYWDPGDPGQAPTESRIINIPIDYVIDSKEDLDDMLETIKDWVQGDMFTEFLSEKFDIDFSSQSEFEDIIIHRLNGRFYLTIELWWVADDSSGFDFAVPPVPPIKVDLKQQQQMSKKKRGSKDFKRGLSAIQKIQSEINDSKKRKDRIVRSAEEIIKKSESDTKKMLEKYPAQDYHYNAVHAAKVDKQKERIEKAEQDYKNNINKLREKAREYFKKRRST